MMKMIRLAVRNALRNGRRTLLTAATVTIGTAFTVVMLTFVGGIFDSMMESYADANGPIRVVTTAYAERELLQPLHENIETVDPVVQQIADVPGIATAVPMIRTGVLVSIGEELGEDTAMLVGSTQEWYDDYVLADSTFSAGGWLSEGADDQEIVLGGRIARELSAKVGDEILVMGTTQYGSMAPISPTVVGIVSGNSSVDSQAYVSLETARWLTDIPDGALEILVYPESRAEPDLATMASTLSAQLGADFQVRPWFAAPLWEQNKAVMDSIEGIMSVIIVFIMALAIFNTMTMSVLERTGEIGVLRAMGQSRTSAVSTFLAEATVIGLLGGAAGAAIGAIPALYLERNGYSYDQQLLDEVGSAYALNSTLYGDFNAEIVVIALLIGATTAILGAVFPALRAARIQPYQAMLARR